MHLVEWNFGEQGDAVPALLAVGFDIVAESLDLGARKALVDGLDLLQADNVRLLFVQPAQQQFDARLDAVDVPGSDTQGHVWLLR